MTPKIKLKPINANEHLTSLGWAGPGHSLDSHTSNRGLSKPLLVTHKQNTRGLGSRSAKERQADQWWLHAFDTALRQINAQEKAEHSGTSALERVQQYGLEKGGLYGWFKRGETLGSTFDEEPSIVEQFGAQDVSDMHYLQSSHRRSKADKSAHKKHLAGSEPGNAGCRKDSNDAPTNVAVSKPFDMTVEASQRALIKAEIKRQRRQGAFDAPSTFSLAEQKQYSKKLRREAKKQIKARLSHPSPLIDYTDSPLHIQAEELEPQVEGSATAVTVTPLKKTRRPKTELLTPSRTQLLDGS